MSPIFHDDRIDFVQHADADAWIEAVAAEEVLAPVARTLDMTMLASTGGRARTSAERNADSRPTRSRSSGRVCGFISSTDTSGGGGACCCSGLLQAASARVMAQARPNVRSGAIIRRNSVRVLK